MKKLFSFLALLAFSFLQLTPVHAQEDVHLYKKKESVYFVQEHNLVNMETGETKSFLPRGYELVNPPETYDPLPEFMIARKGNNLFAYDVKSEKLTPIFPNNLLLGKKETVVVYPSISEKEKFFIEINDHAVLVNDEPFQPNGTRSYFFDASKSELTPTNNIIFDHRLNPYVFKGCGESGTCMKYDSKHQRFFAWSNGHGKMSELPLYILNLMNEGETKEELFSFSDFGLEEDYEFDYILGVYYHNGLFFIASKSDERFEKIVVIDPKEKEVKKEFYTLSEEVVPMVKKEIESERTLSLAMDTDLNTLILGTKDAIVLLSPENTESKLLTQIRKVEQKNAYAEKIFLYDDEIYFKVRDHQDPEIRLLDLKKGKIVKSFPTKLEQEITLIKK